MPLQLSQSTGQSVSLDRVSFIREESAYTLSGGTASVEISIPFLLPYDQSYDDANFETFMFSRTEYSENDIFQVYEKHLDTRIGWIFPLQALQSKQHNYSADIHFLKYAKVAFSHLCNGQINGYKKTPTYPSDGYYDLNSFYHENSFVFVLSKQTLSIGSPFDISKYIPFFYSIGFYYQTLRDPATLTQSKYLQYSGEDLKRITLDCIPATIQNEQYIYSLLRDTLPYENSRLMAFFHLYQIVELLIDKIFMREQKETAERISAAISKPYAIKEIMEELPKNLSEKNRLRRLFDNYLAHPPDHNDLRQACNTLLSKHDRKNGQQFFEYLYRVRNLVFHEYRSIESEEELFEVVENFKPLICEMLMQFNIQEVAS
jgi:hypothetical protein